MFSVCSSTGAWVQVGWPCISRPMNVVLMGVSNLELYAARSSLLTIPPTRLEHSTMVSATSPL